MTPTKKLPKTETPARATDTDTSDDDSEDIDGGEDEDTDNAEDTVEIETGFGVVKVPAADLDHTPAS
jgi:hypothetical protein